MIAVTLPRWPYRDDTIRPSLHMPVLVSNQFCWRGENGWASPLATFRCHHSGGHGHRIDASGIDFVVMILLVRIGMNTVFRIFLEAGAKWSWRNIGGSFCAGASARPTR